jgi:hypothetical protein
MSYRGNVLLRIFEDANSSNNGYGYVFLDLNPKTSPDFRIQGNIIEEKDRPRIIYKLDFFFFNFY